MFASQLLRILQTIPSDARNESCVSEEDMIMKEYHHKSLGRETHCVAFEAKEIYQLNDSIRDTNPSVFEVKGRDERWNPFLDDDNENGTRDQNGLSYNPISLDKDANSLSSNKNPKPELEEYSRCDENESRDPRSLYIAASDLFEKNKNLFTEKIVLECESPPEVIVRYKEINYHIVKDISVDEGMPLEDNFYAESSKDDQFGHSSYGVDLEFFESAASSLDDTEGVSANHRGSKEEIDDKSESPSESSFEEDIAKDCGLEGSKQRGETNFGATSKNATDAVEEDSFIDKTLPFQDFGTRSFLRSFLHSLDSESTKPEQVPDQISSGKAISEGPDESSAEAWLQEDVQASSLYYNSQVERGSITFNFNSPTPLVAEIEDGTNENVKEHSIDSENVLDHKDEDADVISDVGHVQFDNIEDKSITEQTPEIKNDGFSDGVSAPSQDECVISKNVNGENVHDEPHNHKDDISSVGQGRNSISSDGQIDEQCVCEHEHRNSGNEPVVVSQSKYEVGECSFSALITYEGPIAYSGSLSVRSDSSAASGRSFAFPILQSEWSSSPVRMVNADGTHCRKHKGWRSGILCCKF